MGEGHAALATGDLIRFVSRISRPRNFGIPGEFDYERYLAFQKVYATAFSRTASEVILIREGVAYPLQNQMDQLAADLGKQIGLLLPSDEGAVLRALLLGESGLVPKDTRDTVCTNGSQPYPLHLRLPCGRDSAVFLFHGVLRGTLFTTTAASHKSPPDDSCPDNTGSALLSLSDRRRAGHSAFGYYDFSVYHRRSPAAGD